MSSLSLGDSPVPGPLILPWESQGLAWKLSEVTPGPVTQAVSEGMFSVLPAWVRIFVCSVATSTQHMENPYVCLEKGYSISDCKRQF